MKIENKLIVHGLMKVSGKFLLIKRTEMKKGKPNSFPNFWDIPGGMVENGELPKESLVREVKEETNFEVIVRKIIHEDSNFDVGKSAIFTRLVYFCEVINDDVSNIKLQVDEHNEYKLIETLDEMKGEKIVDYVGEIFGEIVK